MIFINTSGRSGNGIPGGGIGCLIIGAVALFVTFYLLKWFFQFLWWASPALLVLALIINWRSVANTGRAMLRTLQRNTVLGLLYLVLAIVGFPIFAAYLFLQALAGKRIEKIQQEFGQTGDFGKDSYTDYEELDSRPKDPR